MKNNYKELEHKIIAKAWKDPEFKKKLLKNPRETIESFIKTESGFEGMMIPKDYKIKVVEAEEKTLIISIPPAPQQVRNLSDAELELVAAAGLKLGGEFNESTKIGRKPVY